MLLKMNEVLGADITGITDKIEYRLHYEGCVPPIVGESPLLMRR